MWGLVPLRSPKTAKSRLAPMLSDLTRRAVFWAMAEQVFRALADADGIRGVAVVTASPDVAARARGWGARVITEDQETSLVNASRIAAVQLATAGAEGVLILPGDLPFVEPTDVEPLLRAAPGTPAVILAPDRRHQGTNALLIKPPGLIVPRFGYSSFTLHQTAARVAGVTAAVVERPALAFDLDDPADLADLRAWLGGTPPAWLIPRLYDQEPHIREALTRAANELSSSQKPLP